MGGLIRCIVASSLLAGCAGSPSPLDAPTRLIAISPPAPIVLDAPRPEPIVGDDTRARAAVRAQRQIDRAGPPPEPYVLTPRVRRLDVSVGTATTVACTIEVGVSSVGADGAERWDAGHAATAIGRALVTASSSTDVDSSVDACVDSAAREAVRRRVGPFLERSVAAR